MPGPANVGRRDSSPVPYRVDLGILGEGRQENIAAHPTGPPRLWSERGTLLNQRSRQEVPRHETQIAYHPFDRMIVEENESGGASGLNAPHHRLVGGVRDPRSERMRLALQLKRLVAFRTTEVHDFCAGLGRLERIGRARRTIEVLGDPRLRDDPRRLRSTCEP